MNNCSVCGNVTSFINRRKIAGNNLACGNCIKKARSLSIKQLASLKSVTSEDIKRSISESNVQGDELLEFKASKKILDFIHFDNDNKKWLIPSQGMFNPTQDLIFSYGDIIDFELLEDGESVASGGLGRALVGGVLFGGAGAVVGGVTGKRKRKGVCTSLKIKVTINDIDNPVIYIEFVKMKVKKSSHFYKLAFNAAQECLSTFQLICDKRGGDGSERSAAPSPADELKKFKELLDTGVITDEEFEVKKRELLNL